MKYIKLFESFEKLTFSELGEDNIYYNFIDDIDSGKYIISFRDGSNLEAMIRSRRINFFNVRFTNLYNRDNINPDANGIIAIIKIKHTDDDNSSRANISSGEYERYINQVMIQKFKRIYNYYDVNIFLNIESINISVDPLYTLNVLIQENLHDNRYNQQLKPGERSFISESNKEDSNLIIVDVQKSFKRFFTNNYLNALNNYSKEFDNVYQIWDNHPQGKNIDKDYLYDENPDKPTDNPDLYVFPNQKDLIEKRYNYDVDADFYKKILDEKTYQEVKEKENKGLLKRGDIFPTTEGTIIVYIGNKHVWHHCPKKLYELFLNLKGKEITMVGGSLDECYADIETTAKALGVSIKRDFGYIYSATNCPIK